MATIYGDHGPTYADWGLLYGSDPIVPANAGSTVTLTSPSSAPSDAFGPTRSTLTAVSVTATLTISGATSSPTDSDGEPT